MNIEKLYGEIAPRLTNWLVASGSSYHEACDLVQNTFLKIWNLRKNAVRDDARLSFVEEIKDEDAGSVGPTASPSDSEYLRQRLAEAFSKLPPILREAYTLFQIGEMSVRDIANQTGISENLVKVRIFRAKEKLREILSDLRVT